MAELQEPGRGLYGTGQTEEETEEGFCKQPQMVDATLSEASQILVTHKGGTLVHSPPSCVETRMR